MKWLRSIGIAFSMYSKIPMPNITWSKESMRYAFCFFPLVGVVIGGLTWGIGGWLFQNVQAGKIPVFFSAVCLTLLPLLITGGIHMDGFMDTSDARHSYCEREKKLEILKDSNTGAFAVICMGMYLLWSVAVWSVASKEVLPGYAAGCIVSRTLSTLSVTICKGAKKDGLAATFRDSAKRKAVCISTAVYLIVTALMLAALGEILVPVTVFAAAAGIFFWYLRMAKKEFGGITGDLAGFFLQVCELGILTALTAVTWIL